MTNKMRGKILVIDDDRVASDIIVKTLLSRGFDVSVVANPDRGMEKAQEDSPDLVFISLFFPDSNGLKVSKRIHSLEGLEKVPVVMLISYKGELDPKYTSTIGIIDVLVKPLKPEEIISKITKVLGKNALSEAAVEPASPAEEEAAVPGEEEGLSQVEGSLPVSPAAEELPRPPDFPPYETLHAGARKGRTEYDETEEFLKEEVEEGKHAPAGEAPAEEQLPEEGMPDSGMRFAFEEEISSGEEPRGFFAGKRVVAVAAVCAVLVVGIGAYGLKKIMSRTEKAAQSKQVPAVKDLVKDEAGRPTVPEEGAPQNRGKAAPAKTREDRPKEAQMGKKEAATRKEDSRPVSPPPPKPAESAGGKEKATSVSKQYGFSVQVGAFGSEKNANSLVAELKKKGYDAFVEKEDVKPVYRVLVGSFPDANKASEQAKALQKDGLKTIVRRGRG